MSDFEHPQEPRKPRPWLCFRVGPQPYAVPLESAAEIIEVEGLVRLPLCPPGIVGYCLYRRDLVPVVALTDSPGPDFGALATHLVIAILRTSQGTWGFAIDREGEFVAEDVLDPDAWRTSGPSAAVVIGSIRRQARIACGDRPGTDLAATPGRDRTAQGSPVDRAMGRPADAVTLSVPGGGS